MKIEIPKGGESNHITVLDFPCMVRLATHLVIGIDVVVDSTPLSRDSFQHAGIMIRAKAEGVHSAIKLQETLSHIGITKTYTKAIPYIH